MATEETSSETNGAEVKDNSGSALKSSGAAGSDNTNQPNDVSKIYEQMTNDGAETTAAANNPPAATPTTPTASLTGGTTGLFSRVGTSFGVNSSALNEVYDRAQKRAVQLKEQAVTEVERLRQQREQQQQQQQAEAEISIPPAAGTLVVGGEDMEGGVVGTSDTDNNDKQEDQQQSLSTNDAVSATETKETAKSNKGSPLRSAIEIARQTSLAASDAAKDLIFPYPDSELESGSSYESSYSQDDSGSGSSDNNSRDGGGVAAGRSAEEEDEGATGRTDDTKKEIFRGRNNGKDSNADGGDSSSETAVATATTPTVSPTRFAVATSAISNAMLRYGRSRVKESASFDSASVSSHQQQMQQQTPSSQQQTPIVGGADRVGGLRYFQLDGIIPSTSLPPSLPLAAAAGGHPPGRDALSMQTGGEWTMASNRGPNAINATPPFAPIAFTKSPSTISDAGSVTTNASEDGRVSVAGASPRPPRSHTRTSYYEDAVRSVLKPGQRALFFGKGTMGVVLKPTYLASWRGKDGGGLLSPTTKKGKKGGVFIDSLILGGHADKSGVVFVGDHVVKIGAVNVECMTLEEVVNVIQETPRPNIMILTSEHEVELAAPAVAAAEDLDGKEAEEADEKKYFTSPLDVAFGFMNKVIAEGGDLGNDLNREISRTSLLDDDDDEESARKNDDGNGAEEEEVSFGTTGKEEGDDDAGASSGADEGQKESSSIDDDNNDHDNTVEPESTSTQSSNQKNPPHPSYDINTLVEYASHRTNTHDNDAEIQHKRSSLLKRAALFNSDFRLALRLSLSDCVVDPRRYSFLEHFFKNYLSRKELEMRRQNSNSNNNQEAKATEDDDVTSSKNQRRLLELYLELCKFHDVMMVCSVSDREKLLGHARSISTLFLSEAAGLPEHVAHIALGGMEKVQSLRFALRDEDEFFEGNDSGSGDGFDSIRTSLESFLSTQEAYLSFLLSNDCARMRAYLRGCSSFLCVDPQTLLKSNTEDSDSIHHNFLLHAILHLICMKESSSDQDSKDDEENNNFIKNDALLLSSGKRNMGAASLLCCAIFIRRSLKDSIETAVEALIEDGMTGTSNNMQVYSKLVEDLQFFWEVFVAPAGGSLSSLTLSEDTQDALDAARRLIVSSVDKVLKEETSEGVIPAVALARMLSSAEVSSSVYSLEETLLREYTLTIYPNFCRHIFHEWACTEAKECRYDKNGEYMASAEFSGLATGWQNRFLRQMEFPDGLSLHRPSPFLPKEEGNASIASPDCFHNGDVALVFGSGTTVEEDAAVGTDNIRRFSCVSLHPDADGPGKKVLLPADIPPIFENYAMVPPFHERPFQGMLQDERNHRISIDGWEVSLTNFVIPSQGNGDSHDDNWMYCVSLVFHKSSNARPQISEQEINNGCVRELVHDNSSSEESVSEFSSPLFVIESEDETSRRMKVSQELKEFNSKLQEQKWSEQIGQGATIGLALISKRNVTHAMRETLSLLYNDICSVTPSSQNQTPPRHMCQPLVDLLGVLSHSQEVEEASLNCLLQPYVAFTTSRWIHRPLSDQSDIFSEAAGIQLLQALPPVPLALAFVTILLEQKVVFSSSRRGVLMAASFAMMQMLKPLKWAHLQVPLVPVSMMNELIHYPAPFVLGIPTDEKESAAILGALPNDVTLVDLDVGRVILASVFANDTSKSVEGANGISIARALRTQVLFLAESLGGAFGAAMCRNSWCSDSPLQALSSEHGISADHHVGSYLEVLNICEAFVSELLSGIHSCCLWIEEKHNDDQQASTKTESAIIFDEDRFFHIKNLRGEGRYLPLIQKSDTTSAKFSLSLDHFDLIFETFLRSQCLSTYISDGNKESMLFW